MVRTALHTGAGQQFQPLIFAGALICRGDGMQEPEGQGRNHQGEGSRGQQQQRWRPQPQPRCRRADGTQRRRPSQRPTWGYTQPCPPWAAACLLWGPTSGALRELWQQRLLRCQMMMRVM